MVSWGDLFPMEAYASAILLVSPGVMIDRSKGSADATAVLWSKVESVMAGRTRLYKLKKHNLNMP